MAACFPTHTVGRAAKMLAGCWLAAVACSALGASFHREGQVVLLQEDEAKASKLALPPFNLSHYLTAPAKEGGGMPVALHWGAIRHNSSTGARTVYVLAAHC